MDRPHVLIVDTKPGAQSLPGASSQIAALLAQRAPSFIFYHTTIDYCPYALHSILLSSILAISLTAYALPVTNGSNGLKITQQPLAPRRRLLNTDYQTILRASRLNTPDHLDDPFTRSYRLPHHRCLSSADSMLAQLRLGIPTPCLMRY